MAKRSVKYVQNSVKRKGRIENVIKRQAKLFNIKLYSMAVFIKAVSGLIARITLGVEKGKQLGLRFWEGVPFSRIIDWGKGYFTVKEYILRNELESCGVIPYAHKGKTKDKAKYRYEKTPLPAGLLS
jgi:hypothetical protein